MRAALIASFAALAVAAPAPAVTKAEVVDVYVTVYDDGTPAGPTPEPEPEKKHWGGWGNWGAPAAPVDVPAAPVEAAPEAPAAPATPYSGGGATSGDYQTAVVEHHNAHRANHSADALVWDSNLANIAMQI